MNWDWIKGKNPKTEPVKEQSAPTVPTPANVDQAIADAERALEEIRKITDPAARRVDQAVQRNRQGVKTEPARVSDETLAADDAKAKAAIAESKTRQQQQGESDADYQFRINRLNEKEIRRHLTGAQCMERDALIQKMAHDDFLRKTPYPVGKIVKIEDGRYVCQFQPHPNLPKKQMTGDCLVVRQVMKPYMEDNEPRLVHVKGEVGDTGTLRCQSDGLTINWFFVVAAA